MFRGGARSNIYRVERGFSPSFPEVRCAFFGPDVAVARHAPCSGPRVNGKAWDTVVEVELSETIGGS